jgi:hypothetical protein
VKGLFEIEWAGAAAEKHWRKLRPFVSELPWGTLDVKRYAPELVDRARIAWSSIAMSEYRAAAAFADVLAAMLAARAPLDIVGMGGDFVADELMHVELASRLAMELGGGAPIQADFETMGVEPTMESSALERCNDLVVRVGCIAETISGAIALETRAVVEHPLVHGIVERIARDEAPHTSRLALHGVGGRRHDRRGAGPTRAHRERRARTRVTALARTKSGSRAAQCARPWLARP